MTTSVILLSQPRCSTGSCITPSSFKSKAPAIACASTPHSFPRTSAPMHSPIHPCRNGVAARRRKDRAINTADPRPQTRRRSGEFYTPTIGETSAPVDTCCAYRLRLRWGIRVPQQ